MADAAVLDTNESRFSRVCDHADYRLGRSKWGVGWMLRYSHVALPNSASRLITTVRQILSGQRALRTNEYAPHIDSCRLPRALPPLGSFSPAFPTLLSEPSNV